MDDDLGELYCPVHPDLCDLETQRFTGVRLAPGLYTTEADIDATIVAVEAIARS